MTRRLLSLDDAGVPDGAVIAILAPGFAWEPDDDERRARHGKTFASAAEARRAARTAPACRCGRCVPSTRGAGRATRDDDRPSAGAPAVPRRPAAFDYPRLPDPSPDEVRAAREELGLTLAEAAAVAGLGAGPRWAEYENGKKRPSAAVWELFLLRTGQHPTHRLVELEE